MERGGPVKCARGDIYESVPPFVDGEAQWDRAGVAVRGKRTYVRG